MLFNNKGGEMKKVVLIVMLCVAMFSLGEIVATVQQQINFYKDLGDRFLVLYETYKESPSCLKNPHICELLEGTIQHFKVREGISKGRIKAIRIILREVVRGNYKRYSRNWRSVARDLVLCFYSCHKNPH